MCGKPEFKGDGNCDDGNNNQACEYDGGDCCAKSVMKNGAKTGKVITNYCKQVGVKRSTLNPNPIPNNLVHRGWHHRTGSMLP